jgi:hypothetical protein
MTVGTAIAGNPTVQPENGASPTELVVTFRESASLAQFDQINAEMGIEVVGTALDGRVVLVQVPVAASLFEVKSRYESLPEVESVEPNPRVEIQPRR